MATKPPLSSSKSLWQRFFTGAPARLSLIALTVFATVGTVGLVSSYVRSSDHDDGEVDTKGRNLNLTDLFVFREQDQNSAAAPGNLVLIMNTNPRSLARQQYYFSTRARYEFKITRVADKNAPVTGVPNAIVRFEFGAPDANKQQAVKITTIVDGNTTVAMGKTTPLGSASQPVVNNVSLGGANATVFAGLREDPFFFDVEQYFRVRAGARGMGPAVGFRPASTAVDFTKGYNVNAIAISIPISLISGGSSTVFDVWETISLPGAAGKYTQVERLARPVINEGLVVENDFLNALNAVGPDFEAAALAGQQPAAGIAAPIVADVVKTLKAVGNSDARVNALLGAFLPDVMRIDTAGPSGYANDLNEKLSPVRGRLIKDDVFDITIGVLTNGAITTDNVSYEGAPGNPAQGHQPLVPTFPYLALPN
ncbi:DUF4331 domain-containing protein [Phormidium sp. CLA17]|uniref:DUF4331 domain-containing protein n=1 Tax=Leptolyngbya sp. Cla-17 TaxID=2803751 RepID=UPI0014928FA4|nr:DUF4331 domain-containing protein [Leptolyngbya sp. Cla-17]MBM0741990.1 DUF4331 domain-containing protein [Leptolyngbya sp. Cla-17]